MVADSESYAAECQGVTITHAAGLIGMMSYATHVQKRQ